MRNHRELSSVVSFPSHLVAGALGLLLTTACGEEPTAPQEELTTATGSMLWCNPNSAPPVMSLESQTLAYECTGREHGNDWKAPAVTAVNACGVSVAVHRYNTGDDDEDGVPGSEDPDDFGPGPTTELEGQHLVEYLAWNSRGDIAETTLWVDVKDTLEPVITLNGPESMQLECFLPRSGPSQENPGPYLEQGASAVDQCSGDLSKDIILSGEVNQQTPGVYSIEYRVSDLAGLWAAPAVRTVEVLDTLPPVVTVAPPISLAPANGTLWTGSLNECMEIQDQCQGYMDANSRCGITSIISDEPGEDAGDLIFEEGSSTFSLRARASARGDGRVYKVSFMCSDDVGNLAGGECTFEVPAGQ